MRNFKPDQRVGEYPGAPNAAAAANVASRKRVFIFRVWSCRSSQFFGREFAGGEPGAPSALFQLEPRVSVHQLHRSDLRGLARKRKVNETADRSAKLALGKGR